MRGGSEHVWDEILVDNVTREEEEAKENKSKKLQREWPCEAVFHQRDDKSKANTS